MDLISAYKKQDFPGMVVQAWNQSYLGSRDWEITV
jgi:hypothetical protein